MRSSPPSILELVLRPTKGDGEHELVAEWRRPGEPPVRRVRTLRIDADELATRIDPEAYGEALGRAVFDGEVRELFAQARLSDLRVLLTVDSDALRSLRWERLAGPFEDDQWRLLGQSQRTPLSLHLPSGSDRSFPPLGRRELRALVVIANPEPGNAYGVEPFDETAALDTVLEGLGSIPSVVLGKDPRAAGPPTLEQIHQRLTAERFTLLHVVAHGTYGRRAGRDMAVFLDDEPGRIEAVPATALLERLHELGARRGLPHLAFLAVCNSARPDAAGVFGGLAQRMVRELGMPAVVAMTDAVTQATALTLGRAFYARLRDHGEVDRALVEASVEVRKHRDVVVPALFSRLGGRPLLVDDLDRPLTREELAAAAERLDALFLERAPSLRARARALASTVAVDPAVLGGQASLEHQRALASLEQLCEDALELSFTALAHGREPPPYDLRCPFPGRHPFGGEDRELFFGRDALSEGLLEQLQRHPVLVLSGASGCGKSSLVEAGMLPRLCDRDPELVLARLRPGEHPLAELEAVLPRLEAAPGATVLHVEQLGQVFLRCPDPDERKAFFDRLLALATPERRLVITMRGSFVEDCEEHEGLRAEVEKRRRIRPLSSDELRRAVEAQGEAAGLRFETGLVSLVHEDVEGEPGAMSLLQQALRELYERRHGRWLRVETWEELGRMAGVVTTMAERVVAGLAAVDQKRLRAIVVALTEQARDGSTRHQRRQLSLDQLVEGAPAERAELQRLVDDLASDGLLVETRDDELGTLIEVAHVALLREWEPVRGWLAAAAEGERRRELALVSPPTEVTPSPAKGASRTWVAVVAAALVVGVGALAIASANRGDAQPEALASAPPPPAAAAGGAPEEPSAGTNEAEPPPASGSTSPAPSLALGADTEASEPTGDSEPTGGSGSAAESDTKTTPTTKPVVRKTSKSCRDDRLAKRVIDDALRGRGCDRVSVTIHGGRLKVTSPSIDEDVSDRIEDCTDRRYPCPD